MSKQKWAMTVAFVVVLAAALMGYPAGADPPVPIEGTILVSASEISVGVYTYLIEGMSDSRTPVPGLFPYGELSPDMERVAYQVVNGNPPTTSDVWVARIDGSAAVNVTGLAAVGAVNCKPAWSPDGLRLAFQHAEPTETLLPCQVGFHVWVINTDGTGAHRVTSPGTVQTLSPTWSPNGFRLSCSLLGVGAITIDSDGSDVAVLPNVGGMADWSPDGKHIVSTTAYEGVDGGQNGVWRGLLLTDADGGNPEVLYQHFLTEADAAKHIALYGDLMPEDEEIRSMRANVGPCDPDWSPKGDRILFRAAIPFDALGLFIPYQNDLWLYDLTDDTLTQITEGSIAEFSHSWNGPNTFPDDPEVTVDNVTVTFSAVTREGITTIMRDDDPPEAPIGYRFNYDFYELKTTAEVTGPASICMTYTDEQVPPEAEAELAILHYDEQEQAWEDITISRDPVNNIICGQTDSLSPVALYGIRKTKFSDVPAWGFGTGGLDPYWAYYEVMACVEAGIVGGYKDSTYRPTAPVFRDQMAVYIARAMAGGDAEVPPGPTAATFEDVPKTGYGTDGTEPYWAYRYIEYCVGHRVVKGYTATRYRPELVVSREQMAVFVARSQGWVDMDDDMTSAPQLFSDVPAGFRTGTAIKACVDNGVVGGYKDGSYRPGGDVTRDQLAVFVQRAFDLPM